MQALAKFTESVYGFPADEDANRWKDIAWMARRVQKGVRIYQTKGSYYFDIRLDESGAGEITREDLKILPGKVSSTAPIGVVALQASDSEQPTLFAGDEVLPIAKKLFERQLIVESEAAETGDGYRAWFNHVDPNDPTTRNAGTPGTVSILDGGRQLYFTENLTGGPAVTAIFSMQGRRALGRLLDPSLPASIGDLRRYLQLRQDMTAAEKVAAKMMEDPSVIDGYLTLKDQVAKFEQGVKHVSMFVAHNALPAPGRSRSAKTAPSM